MAAFEAVVALWSAQQSLAGWCVGTINIRSKKTEIRIEAKMSEVADKNKQQDVLFFTRSIPKARFFAAGFGHCPISPIHFNISFVFMLLPIRLSTAAPCEQHNSRQGILAYDSPCRHNHLFFQWPSITSTRLTGNSGEGPTSTAHKRTTEVCSCIVASRGNWTERCATASLGYY